MNTWVVGNVPVGLYQYRFPKTILHQEEGIEELGEKVFFMKARIMGGQMDLKRNIYGDTDYQWLTKEEIADVVTRQYWASIQNMMGER
jgi:large subunit ribosomal protein L46